MHLKSWLLALTLLGMSNFGYATSWHGRKVYLIQAHYSAEAFGKEVASVMVHSGVSVKEQNWGLSSDKTYWVDVQDHQLTRYDRHFQSTFLLHAQDGKFMPSILGPVVQYWVTFKDGSSLISDAYAIPVKNQVQVYEPDAFVSGEQAFLESVSHPTPIDETEAEVITWVTIS